MMPPPHPGSVSAVIVVRNGAAFLADALGSIAAQQRPPDRRSLARKRLLRVVDRRVVDRRAAPRVTPGMIIDRGRDRVYAPST
jgi:hypothetical protein